MIARRTIRIILFCVCLPGSVLICCPKGGLHAQDELSQFDGFGIPEIHPPARSGNSDDSSTGSAPRDYEPPDLLAVEQLILMLSNRPDERGAPQESLVFLGRSPQRGWESIGLNDLDELRSHWRAVASRVLLPYTQVGLTAEQRESIDLALELSIAQFIRLYKGLREDFLQQPDQKSRLSLISSDGRYELLRQLGREGIFKKNSLIGKTIHTILADQP